MVADAFEMPRHQDQVERRLDGGLILQHVGEQLAEDLRLQGVELVVFDERLADRDAARLEEGVRHRAADDQPIDFSEQVLDHLDLVRHLGAAEDRDERALGRFERVPEILQFLFHQQPGRRARQRLRDRFNRRVRPMRRAKRIVHVQIGERGEGRRELRIVLFFFGMESEVLEQDDAARAPSCLLDRALRDVTDAVVGESHRLPQKLRQASGNRSQTELRRRLALGAPQMARQDHGGAVVERAHLGGGEHGRGVGCRGRSERRRCCGRDRRQRPANARVVADHAVLQGHVEIHPEKDAPAFEIEIPDGKLHSPFFTSSRSRSTQRFE